jgi:hypothetical protein
MRWIYGDGVTLDVLATSEPFLADTGDDVNENSIVVMLHDGAYRELFMGDAGEASESRLLAPCHPEQRRGAAKDMTVGGPSTALGVTRGVLAMPCDDDLHADVGTWDVGRGTWEVGRGTWDVGRGESRPSRIALRIYAGVRCCGPSAGGCYLGRAAQHVRPPGAVDDRDVDRRRGTRPTNRSVRSNLTDR